MRKGVRKLTIVLIGALVVWTALTFWATYFGGAKEITLGNRSSSKTALIVYNPDPIYNLDEQICSSFGKGISSQNFFVKIATVASAKNDSKEYDLYVFCANTYNWAPDWLIKSYIQEHSNLNNKNAIAITLGAGSTERAKRIMEDAINTKQAELIDSKTYWLLKPNDENRMEEKNVEVAKDMAEKFGAEIGRRMINVE